MNGLRRQSLVVAGDAAWHIIGAEPNEVFLQELSGDLVNLNVTGIDVPQLEVTLIALQGVGLNPSAALYCIKPSIAFRSGREPLGLCFMEIFSWCARFLKR